MARPIFSGHESFACKSHWLKRGYDFVRGENNFNDDDAVVRLGVGKNMVASIKFWLKAIGLLKDTGLVAISDYLFDDENGKDPYLEDVGTLWLLHFLLIDNNYATIYKTTFVDYHRLRNIVEKSKLLNYIKYTCYEEAGYKNLYNENTVKRDIAVMFGNYCVKNKGKVNVEDSNSLFAPLNLVCETDKDTYRFNYDTRSDVPNLIFLYALLVKFEGRNSISFEDIAELALIFCLTNNDLLNIINHLCDLYPSEIVFSDVAGIKELQFRAILDSNKVLDRYYEEN